MANSDDEALPGGTEDLVTSMEEKIAAAGLSDAEREVLDGVFGAAAKASEAAGTSETAAYGIPWGHNCIRYSSCYYGCVYYSNRRDKWVYCGRKCQRQYPGCN
jgi:hypothetical protein